MSLSLFLSCLLVISGGVELYESPSEGVQSKGGRSTKDCLEFIKQTAEPFRQHPFHLMLEDDNISHEKRLAGGLLWMPIIMGYSDLNNYVFRDEEKNNDLLQRELNIHTYAEDYHWHWMLEDYRRLGIDLNMSLTNLARLLYSPQLAAGRQFTFEMVRIESLYPKSFHHMAMMKSIEEISLQTTKLYVGFKNKDGEEFEFWGTLHYQAEMSHELHDHIDPSADQFKPLTETEFEECTYVANRTLRALNILYTHLLNFATDFDI